MNILWDFDGTLFDTYPIYSKIFKKVVDEDIPEKEIYKLLKISFSHAVNYYQLSKEQIETMNEYEDKISPKDMLPFPHVENILKFANNNVIMTHKTRKGVNDILDYYNWNQYFTEIITIDDGYPRKPHPASYEYLHKNHQLDLIIGDRELDILPGKKLGIYTCLFQNNQPGADFYLSDYKDFSNVVNISKGG
ncbi:HAD-IA family hydrolase [Heyndrickxia sp. NPDC080065]|uniref:HAD-IA family hydrolase n=1 Tax=Heyndrickxia sp. NPDC080065 TaxID=3390568 RepID=UPI003D095215